MKQASLVVVSGPSGSGKTSLTRKVAEELEGCYLSISTTTRLAREGEVDGVDYYFVSRETFLKEIEEGSFLEWAEVHGNFYGTSLKRIKEAQEEGKTVLFDIDVQGHRAVRKIFSSFVTSVFVTTPSMAILKERLKGRGTDDAEIIEKRLINAYGEMDAMNEYDFLLINDTFEESYEILRSIVMASRQRQNDETRQLFRRTWKN